MLLNIQTIETGHFLEAWIAINILHLPLTHFVLKQIDVNLGRGKCKMLIVEGFQLTFIKKHWIYIIQWIQIWVGVRSADSDRTFPMTKKSEISQKVYWVHIEKSTFWDEKQEKDAGPLLASSRVQKCQFGNWPRGHLGKPKVVEANSDRLHSALLRHD